MSVSQECEKVKNNIQKWLLEEGYKIQSKPNKDALFQMIATGADGIKISVLQPVLKLDQIVIVTGVGLDETRQTALQAMENKERLDFLWELRFGLLNIGVSFGGISIPLKGIEMSYPIFYDGLSKDAFMHKFFDIKRAVIFVLWTFDRKFGEPKPKSDLMYRG